MIRHISRIYPLCVYVCVCMACKIFHDSIFQKIFCDVTMTASFLKGIKFHEFRGFSVIDGINNLKTLKSACMHNHCPHSVCM